MEIEATDIKLNKSELELLVGESETLTATLTPQDASEEIVWSVDDAGKNIISVEPNGKVTGLAVGTATVTATAGKVSATCKVTVKPILATSIAITVPDKEVFVGDKITLTATVTPETTTDKTIEWKSGDPSIATIDASTGELTALAPGQVTITATCGSTSGTATITVKAILAQSIKLSAEDITLLVGASQKLTATVSPENTTDQTITWKSDNESIATVSADGTVTGVSVGVANITATCGEVSATCKVTVNPVTASTVTISVPDKDVFVGDKITLTATVTPETTTDKTIEWKSGDPAIATIDASTGELTAVAPGQVTITATCGTTSGTATITVKAILAQSIKLSSEDITLLVGASQKLTATVSPENTTDQTITWKSDNEAIATVSADGTVTGVSVGVANITATCGEVSATCKVTVNPVTASTVTISVPDKDVFVGDKITLTATVTPETTTDKTIEWKSGDPAIATIDASTGELTALAPGQVTITATCGSTSGTATITVKAILAQSIKLSANDLTLLVGASQKLTATVSPENTTDQTITWKSDNEAIATVSADGTVTGVSVGVANITATCGEVSATCKVTVNPVTASTVTISVPDKDVFVGDKITLTATVTPETTTDKTIEWKSGDPAIATIDASTGELTAVAPGQVTITATCGATSGTATITVKAILAQSIKLSAEDITLLVGASQKLTATVSPENTTDRTITWKSDNESIATVSADGTVTGVSVGVANITATCGEASATCKVTVNPVTATSITLNVQDLTLLVGQTDKLTATVSPENTTDQTITWKSDNESIATVSADGTVTGVSVGVANITATCGEVSATCKVTVNPVPSSGVVLNTQNLTLLVGQTEQLKATVLPEDSTDKTVTWKSDNESIATVSADGTVTGVSVGVANITATCGEVSATCKVTVNPVTATSITLNVQDLTLLVGQTDKLTATVSPENTTDQTITWKSDNESIATVSADGTVTGVSVGVANITATCGEVSATCKVTVNPVTATSITLNVQDLTLLVGQTDKLTATVSPENTTDQTITWKSDNEEIATVSADGTVTGVSVGVANITATCGEVSATCKVTVNPVTASSIILNVQDLTLLVGQTDKLTATVSPENTTDQTITWKSDNESIATVSADGTVTGVSVGVANITATCGEVSATCKVTVNPVTASSIILNVQDLTLLVGQTDKLTATVSPENTTDQTITWKSDNESIATVSADGTVTGVSVGVANITATCGEVSATCKVTVNPVPSSGVVLNTQNLTLLVGQTEQLKATVLPEDSTDKTVTWKSDNESIATVSADGTVTGVSVGVANITATCGEVSATCKVTVNPVTASSIILNVQDLTLLVGQTDKLTATVSPENTTDQTITWKSDNESIATVSADGTVTGVSVGVANITATCGEVSATCKVTVNPVPSSGVVLNTQNLTLLVGQTEQLKATVLPEDSTDQTITWKSDNESIATVSADGTVTGVSVGVANITATCGEASATCKVTVNPVTATSITLNVQDLTLLVGQTDKLTATVSPENTTDQTITWKSDNESIATVSGDGTVTGVSVGVANITATCGEASATCKVTVNPVTATSITLNVQDLTLLVGQTDKLTATVSPENTTDQTITWKSDNEAIATVSADGTVTGVSVGVANITATCGEASATCKVTVNPVTASSITLNVQDLTLLVGQTDKLTATVSPENTTDQTITWKSDNEAIATVSADGTVTGVSVGVANITATCGEVSATCKVTVNPVTATSITLNVQDLTLLVGQTDKLTATVSPENTTDQTITWKSDNEAIATVSADGTVTGVSVGVANITATCGEVSATCKVTVNPVTATSITLNVQDLTLLVGQTDKLTATVSPENTTDQTITWKSDNESIATVSADGTVTGVSVGIANITATCGEASATCKVTVNPVTATSITLNVQDLTLLVGQSDKLTATVLPDNTTYPNVKWTSNNVNIATVSADGIVTAVSEGVTAITATCDGVIATCSVTVINRPETPKQLLRKGNGTSCTFIVMMDLSNDELTKQGYNFIYGYTNVEGTDRVIANTPLRYCHTNSSIYNDVQNDFWVIAYWTNESGNIVGSARRHLDGSVDDGFDFTEIISSYRRIDGTNSENWVKPTSNGAQITIESVEDVVINVYTLSGQGVYEKIVNAGEYVSETITNELLVPNTYIITVKSGKDYVSKKIIIR